MTLTEGTPMDTKGFSTVKQEPFDYPEENGLFDYQNQIYYNENDQFDISLPTWSLIVNKCRFLLQENSQYYQFDQNLNLNITKILIKEINDLLQETVQFFQECYNPISDENNHNKDIIEVNGLLVNCLPCHPQNLKCCYKLSNTIPKSYQETFFSPLFNNIEDDLPIKLVFVELQLNLSTYPHQMKWSKAIFC